MILCGIYSITNIVNNKRYFGSTQNYILRKIRHLTHLRHNKHRNIHLQRAFNKYGETNFVFKFEESVDVSQLLSVEQRYIDANIDGYNIARYAGAPYRGRKHSQSTINKIKIGNLGLRKIHKNKKGYYYSKVRNRWIVDFYRLYRFHSSFKTELEAKNKVQSIKQLLKEI